jgi:uncharacterized protein YlzI (FlbEa/FlbD family)
MKLNKRSKEKLAQILKELNQLLDEAKTKYETAKNDPLLKKIYETPDAWCEMISGNKYVTMNALHGDIIKWQTYIDQLSTPEINEKILKYWNIIK